MSGKNRYGIYMVLLLILMLVIGCASSEVARKKRIEYLSTIPNCYEEEECKLRWAASRRWVLNNSSTKIQHLTDDFIETYNPRSSSPEIAVRVVKEPIVNGGYRFMVKVWCDNIFGCSPDEMDAIIDFNKYVNDAAPLSRGFVGLAYDLKTGIVLEVSQGGSAEEAGVLPGDKIIKIDGQPILKGNSLDLKDRISGKAGTEIEMIVIREGKELTLKIMRLSTKPIFEKY